MEYQQSWQNAQSRAASRLQVVRRTRSTPSTVLSFDFTSPLNALSGTRRR